jgi:predicted glycosyltransferase involved in capsule biosynthesis
VIETKLYKNPDKRMVVAQALDYGALLWRHRVDFDEFISQLNSHTEKTFNISFKDKFEDFFQIDSASAFENVQKNLSYGVIKFVVLMDKLHDRLKDPIVYVNQNSKFDFYAVEFEYYKHNEFEIIIPKFDGRYSFNNSCVTRLCLWLFFVLGVGGDEGFFGFGGDDLDVDVVLAGEEEALADGEVG